MSNLFKSFFFITDILLLNLAIFGAFYVYGNSIWITDMVGFAYLIIYSNLAWLFLVMVSAPYGLSKEWSVTKILKNQLSFLFIHLLVILSLVIFFNKSYGVYHIVLIYILFTPVFFCYRLIVYYLRKLATGDIQYYNFLLLGRNALAEELRKFYLMNPDLGYKFIGYVDFENGMMPLEKINQVCSSNEVHEIFCCAPSVNEDELNQLIQFGLNSLIKVKLIFQSDNQNQGTLQLDRFDKSPGVDVAAVALDEFRNQFLKRCFDFVFATLFGLLILSWLIPIIGLIIKLDSTGPVFFVQQRNGMRNLSFGCIKFRTMIPNKQADDKQAVINDPRITKVGAFLRKTSIDELPQFINVIIGNMSLIGPRPHPIKLNEQFMSSVRNLMSRHYVKPGITGLAQCMGYRGETQTLADMDNRVRLDRYYIENWTFWLDIKIIFLTVVSLIRGSDKAF
jgi:putative colanic acid biosysnthesis UDP-glucose lipid carrier transferase